MLPFKGIHTTKCTVD